MEAGTLHYKFSLVFTKDVSNNSKTLIYRHKTWNVVVYEQLAFPLELQYVAYR